MSGSPTIAAGSARETLPSVSPQVPAGAEGHLLTVREVATFLAVTEQTVRTWCHQGAIPHGRLGNAIRFDREELQRWLDERWRNPGPGTGPGDDAGAG